MIQRVKQAEVTVGGNTVGKIGAGLCILLGVGKQDHNTDAEFLSEKIKNLRIFEDAEGKMNLPVRAAGGEVLLVSQFTLYGDCRKGNRPSFTEAAAPDHAENLYEYFGQRLRAAGLKVATGRFQAKMEVSLINDGPVTFILES